MNYFSKIEAYFANEMTDVEQSVFEQELEDNVILQKELEAYQTAQLLFSFVAEKLPESAIITDNAREITDQIINFAANTLSEKEILETETSRSKDPIVHQLKPRTNRTAWLAAASLLFIISLIGLRFQNNQASWEVLGQQDGIVSLPIETAINPIKKTINAPESLEITPETTIVFSKTDEAKTAKTTKSIQATRRVYEPAKIVTKKTSTPTQQLAARTSNIKYVDDRHLQTAKAQPIAMNTSAQEITTKIVVTSGESISYQAEEVIILKNGFHAKPGANFVASALHQKSFVENITLDKTIGNEKKVSVEAEQGITLKPGFHAKAGSAFSAKTTLNKFTSQKVATNAVVSDREKIVYKANDSVTLTEGFHAKPGAEVLVTIAKK